jgi:Cu2+-exporting ATPase
MALAAPLVQVVAAGRLFAGGAYLASGDALERLAAVDHVVFDKTGTLTLGDPSLVMDGVDQGALQAAAQLARASRHPYSRAITRAAGPGPTATDIREHPGEGVGGMVDGRMARLGSAAFVGATDGDPAGLWFRIAGREPIGFRFVESFRPDTRLAIERLRNMGLGVEIISGDTAEKVRKAAQALGVDAWTATATPVSKADRLAALETAGRKVLMVGDGLNDAAAIAGAHASIAPGGAIDVSRLAADCVFAGDDLGAVPDIIEISRSARSRMRENFAFATVYNILAVPIALLGWATPLVAAIAMSGSSAVVTLNALRLAARTGRGKA